jgi:NOL1/NOP2/fmu family ribosome biogenesis protein
MFRKNSLAVEEWSLENVEMCAERQREILTNVAKCVAKGGQLIYSTCTFSQEENEMNVDWFLKTFPEFTLCEVDEELKAVTSDGIPFEGCLADVKKTRRFYPHVSAGEGQYIALFRRTSGDGSAEAELPKKDKKKKERQAQSRPMPEIGEAKRFLDENLVSYPDAELMLYNGSVYLKPRVELPSYGVFAPGVCVGAMTGKTFVPHHQLFSAFGTRFKRQVVLNYGDERVSAYLKGHEIAVSELDLSSKDHASKDGWAAVIVGGCAVGGGKISSGACKNHYPKGMRTKQ